MRRFVIIAPTRSGSTMLYSALLNHSYAICDNECNTRFKRHLHSYEALLAWFEEFYTTRIKDKIRRKQIIKSEVESLSTIGRKDVRARGFKLLYEHYNLIRNAGYSVEDILKQQNIKVIWLTRQSLLQQYISFVFAAITNKWSDEPYPKERFKKETSLTRRNRIRISNGRVILPVSYESPLGLYKINSWLEEERSIYRLLTESDLSILPLTYEQLIHEQERSSHRVCHFLNIPYELLETRKTKQSPNSWEDYVENLEELAEWFDRNQLSERK